jgi:hypothetical protein
LVLVLVLVLVPAQVSVLAPVQVLEQVLGTSATVAKMATPAHGQW